MNDVISGARCERRHGVRRCGRGWQGVVCDARSGEAGGEGQGSLVADRLARAFVWPLQVFATLTWAWLFDRRQVRLTAAVAESARGPKLLGVAVPVRPKPRGPSAPGAPSARMPTTQPLPGGSADDAEVDASPLAKRLRCDRSKAVRFSPAVKALGGGLSQRQGQPLATLQPTSLTGAFSHEGPRQALYPVAESRESSPLGPSVRPSTDDSTQMREGSTGELAASANRAGSSCRVGGPGTPELSTAVRLLPRTPHFDAIARAAAGSSLDGEAEQSAPARSEPQAADAAPLESPLRRIQEATASLMQQLRNVDAATSQIRAYPTLPPPLTPARSHVALPSGSRTALQPLQAEEPPQSLHMTEVNAARQEQPPPEAPANPAEPPPLQANACHAHTRHAHTRHAHAVLIPCKQRTCRARTRHAALVPCTRQRTPCACHTRAMHMPLHRRGCPATSPSCCQHQRRLRQLQRRQCPRRQSHRRRHHRRR